MGGLSRKAFMIEKKADDTALPWLAVDAGALFFASPFLPPADLAQAKISASGIAGAYAKMGFHAINVGRRDLAAGIDFMKKIAADNRLPLVSANITAAGGALVFTPVLFTKIQGVTVAITGVADHNTTFPPGNEAIAISSWRDMLPSFIQQIQAKADLVIVLSNYPARENLTMAREIPRIDIIVQSGHSGANMGPKKIGATAILQTEKRGKYLGMFRVRWNGRGPWQPINRKENDLAQKKRELDGLSWQIRRRDRTLNSQQKKTDTIYRRLSQEKIELERVIATLEKQQQTGAREAPVAVAAGPFYINAFVPLPLAVPENMDIQHIILAAEKEVARLGKLVRPAQKTDLPLVGWRACLGCHEPQTAFWRKTAHFKAYDTLVNKDKETTLSCLPCHVTAPAATATTDSFSLLAMPEDLRGVTCEACHGSGVLHVTAPTAHSMRRRLRPSVCLRCHTPERDDDFVFERDSERIACPAR